MLVVVTLLDIAMHLCVFSCDMIKGNESDVADIVFEILAKKDV